MKKKPKKKNKYNETERIMNNPVNSKHLEESIKQVEEGKLTAIKIEDLWK